MLKAHYYLKTGGYHREQGTAGQDRIFFQENEDYVVAVAADGVTACGHGGRGAALVCEAVSDFAAKEFRGLFDYTDEKLAYLMTEHILYFLEQEAKDGDWRDYASTFSAVLIEKKTGDMRMLNLGDGAVLLYDRGSCILELEPRRIGGIPCFVTLEGAYRQVDVERDIWQPGYGLLLCTDGFLSVRNRDYQCVRILWDAWQSREFTLLDVYLDVAKERDDMGYLAVYGNL